MVSAHITANPAFSVGAIDRRLFGSFVEHLGRCVYDGIYEPDHPLADEDGFRTDVIDLVRELGVTTIRYPGGNFVSGFKWEDSVGAPAERPRRLDLAWRSIETNQVGLHEFNRWLKNFDNSELMLAINLGTRGVSEALELVEYSNVASGTTLSDRRHADGAPTPLNVRMCCLGNEMDGPWQLGHRSAEDYAKVASQTANALRQIDPTLELVVCGSSSAHMPTFGSWERTVLEHTYEDVDFISCHAYYEELNSDIDGFLASGVDMDFFIESVKAIADGVGAQLHSDKVVKISFDEWNVWYQTQSREQAELADPSDWPQAPRLLEDSYSVLDSVVVGSLLISLLKHADRVTSASLAQLVNVIAPIMTEPNGIAWRQTTFFPFAITSRLAQGIALRVSIETDSHSTSKYGNVPTVDSVATFDAANGHVAVFLVNRSTTENAIVSVDLSSFAVGEVLEATTLADSDFYAKNTLEHPERVAPVPNETARFVDGALTVMIPPVSWSAISLG